MFGQFNTGRFKADKTKYPNNFFGPPMFPDIKELDIYNGKFEADSYHAVVTTEDR